VNAKYVVVALGIVGIGAGCSVENSPPTVERATPRLAVDSQQPVVASQRPLADSLCVAHSPQLKLVDSAELGDVFSLIVYRLQVKCDNGLDTLAGIRVKELPVVGGDGNLYGIGYDRHGDLSSGYRYDPNGGKVSLLPLPEYFDLHATHMSLSPDARHVAYIWGGSSSVASGIVRSWPEFKLIAQTPPDSGFESEIDYSQARWLDANRAEFVYTRSGERVPPANIPRRWWIHAVVALDPRSMKVDTVDREPVLQR
jgi:hypothetical protein